MKNNSSVLGGELRTRARDVGAETVGTDGSEMRSVREGAETKNEDHNRCQPHLENLQTNHSVRSP